MGFLRENKEALRRYLLKIFISLDGWVDEDEKGGLYYPPKLVFRLL